MWIFDNFKSFDTYPQLFPVDNFFPANIHSILKENTHTAFLLKKSAADFVSLPLILSQTKDSGSISQASFVSRLQHCSPAQKSINVLENVREYFGKK
ncbi:hypothetical protein [Bacillus sp. MUM 13]|uniref:hypothetical protein n=1 Tax=Bacillus sp. MUM 13 TaxID=1678001 RepID=UPI0008F5E825|nr:hypothetical protein [Bacillus sp. MUM 13]OIK12561.1 hypothetical protein BIV59_08670 [Bacillus sp. MUM 13]